MKKYFDDGLTIIIYTMCGLTLVMASYLIMINICHYKALSYKVTVSEADADYVNYKKNVNDIEDILNKYSNKNNSLYQFLNITKIALKDDSVFRLIPNTQLGYYELYELNDYFINDLINKMWVSNLKLINKNKSNNDMIEILTNNSENLNNHFIDNGLTLYDSYNENRIQTDYHAILENYLAFSNVILNIIQS